MLKPEQSSQQQPMAPMPFYADPNRFTTPVWQADPTQGWTQGQFIQQIPATSQPTLEAYPQQYSNGIYQTTFQQPAGFESNTFYAGAVQVLARPPSAPNQTQLTSRPNGSYSHTPSPVPSQPQQGNQRTNISGQYQQEYNANNQNYVAPATTPTGTVDSSQSGGMSRPSSVNSTGNGQNFQHTNSFTPNSSSNFSPVSNTTSFVNSNTNSGNAMPGYPPVSSHPQLASHNYSGGYPGNEISGQGNSIENPHNENNQHWSPNSDENMWEETVLHVSCNNESAKSDQSEIQYTQSNVSNQSNQILIKTENVHYNLQNDHKSSDQQLVHQMQNAPEQQFSQADRVNLNSRLKTMILQKQQQQLESKLEEAQKIEQNKTGHFLLYSHHHRLVNLGDDGGVLKNTPDYDKLKTGNHFYVNGTQRDTVIKQEPRLQSPSIHSPYTHLQNKTKVNSNDFDKIYTLKQKLESPKKQNVFETVSKPISPNTRIFADPEKQKPTVGLEIPPCDCLPPNQFVPEPGGYYTHLGCSNSLPNLRKDLEERTGVQGSAIRIEKICYTGKEGKTPQGCPIAKWIIRRTNCDEKYLIVVKRRLGHNCFAAVIVVCIVAWDGVLRGDADTIYDMLCNKLNKFGLPTNRRCGTNEPRTCACQGLDPDKCGASFSFGCSWSMYYNGCKYARSKVVRKFRLSVRSEEDEVEERMQSLATFLSPLYKTLAPQSFKNQCVNEEVANDCRLGLKPGRPFSGVTACLDFCAHAHKDTHNMNNGCTVVVTLTKHRDLSKPEDEQLHVLPLYVVDGTDEFGSRDDQEKKIVNGSIEVLHRYQCEVRVRNIPQPTCRRSGKKRKEEFTEKNKNKDFTSPNSSGSSISDSPKVKTPSKQLQSNHVSSTVLDRSSRSSWGYETNLYYNRNKTDERSSSSTVTPDVYFENNKYRNSEALKNFASRINETINNSYEPVLVKQPTTALNLTYPPENSFTRNSSHSYKTMRDHSLSTNVTQYQQNTAVNFSKPISNVMQLPFAQHKVNENIFRKVPAGNYQQISPFGLNLNINSRPQILPSFKYIRHSKNFNDPVVNLDFSPQTNSSHVYVQNPFDDSNSNDFYQSNYYNEYDNFCPSPSNVPSPQTPPNTWHQPFNWSPTETEKSKVLGQVTEIIDNSECFSDSQVGGVAIALTHGSVLFECAKHELHATTALKSPNRESPTRISLVFYQHRNMNKSKHGWDEHEEKMRLKKLDSLGTNSKDLELNDDFKFVLKENKDLKNFLRVPTMTTVTVTTAFPMYPCMVTGPYQEGVKG